MEIIEHFGHEHPLTFREDKYEEDYKPYLCSICRLPILSSPSYTCTIGACEFFLHKPCAQLPQKLKHRLGYNLELKSPPYDNSNCKKCSKSCQNFTYSYRHRFFNLHPLCATSVVIRVKHKSHLEHPLVALCKEISCWCDACGEKHEGFFFLCPECNFLIHKDCALLPSKVKDDTVHAHPLVLTYAPSDLYQFFNHCKFCARSLLGKGIYFCGQCFFAFHLNCVSSNMKNLTSESGQELIHLPSEWDRFPGSLSRNLESERISEDINDDDRKSKIQKYHTNHSLIFHDKHPFLTSKHDESGASSSTITEELVCNGCTQPINISSPFWGCVQPDCHFLLHDFCANNLPSKIKYESFGGQLFLWPDTTKYYFYSVFSCFLCRRPCNGFGYCYDDDTNNPYLCDVECALAPKTATHGSHGGQHVLFLTNLPPETVRFSCCPDESYFPLVYRCVTCDFKIHLGCALLPKKVRHKFDKHPLELVFNVWVEKDCCFCEFCEEDIDQRYWFYHCAQCDQSFHVKCIPSVGPFSKVKFGGALNVSCHPHHPVILTRMLMDGNERCGYCKEIIKGFVDDMAFHCSRCDFWIHFSCANDCSIDQTYGQATRLWYDSLLEEESSEEI